MRKFQLTHPWGCDDIVHIHRVSVSQISTHTPVRVWPIWTVTFDLCPISTHTPVRVWQSFFEIPRAWSNFNSHTREGVTGLSNVFDVAGNFNSHTREGVTITCKCVNLSLLFQLTHPWGCDFPIFTPSSNLAKFQLTHPWGCDTGL